MKTFEEYEKEIALVIEERNIFFIEELFAYYSGLSRSQFYNLELNKSDTLLKKMQNNRTKTKKSMQNKWYKSNNATLQLALMKLIADDEERKRLSQTYTDITTGGEQLNIALVEFIGEDGTDKSTNKD